jgi:hypothetical protein
MSATDSRTLGDQPAIPFSQITESYHQAHAQHRGLTKRELAAFLAIVGAAANDDLDAHETAQRAVSHADALLAVLAGGAA